MTNTDKLYTSYHYDQTTRQRTWFDVYKGGEHPLLSLNSGTVFEILDTGVRGVVMSCYSKNSLVRLLDSQECPMIPGVTQVRVISYNGWQDAGQPKVGEFVEVRKGKHAGKIGLVFTEGVHSTYVVFPDNRNRGLKFAAKDLIVRKDISIIAQ